MLRAVEQPPHCRKVVQPDQAPPHGLDARFAIAGARQEAAQAGDHAHRLVPRLDGAGGPQQSAQRLHPGPASAAWITCGRCRPAPRPCFCCVDHVRALPPRTPAQKGPPPVPSGLPCVRGRCPLTPKVDGLQHRARVSLHASDRQRAWAILEAAQPPDIWLCARGVSRRSWSKWFGSPAARLDGAAGTRTKLPARWRWRACSDTHARWRWPSSLGVQGTHVPARGVSGGWRQPPDAGVRGGSARARAPAQGRLGPLRRRGIL